MTPAWCRRPLQRPVSSAVSCSRFISGLEAVVEDAVSWLHTRDNTGDLLGCLYKVFMEVTGAVTLDHRSALSMVFWLYSFTPPCSGLTVCTTAWTRTASPGSCSRRPRR